MRRSRKFFFRGVPTLTKFLFQCVRGERIQILLSVDDGQALNADLVALLFSGDPDQYYLETL